MQKEIIIHNNKKVTKTTKNNGSISFTQRGVYIGIDIKSGKKSYCFYYRCLLYTSDAADD